MLGDLVITARMYSDSYLGEIIHVLIHPLESLYMSTVP